MLVARRSLEEAGFSLGRDAAKAERLGELRGGDVPRVHDGHRSLRAEVLEDVLDDAPARFLTVALSPEAREEDPGEDGVAAGEGRRLDAAEGSPAGSAAHGPGDPLLLSLRRA